VSFRLGAATAWAEAGHEVAWDQFVLSAPDSQLPPPVRLPRGVNMSGLRAREHGEQVSVTGAGFRLGFKAGQLRSWRSGDGEMLVSGRGSSFGAHRPRTTPLVGVRAGWRRNG